jgi:hypothetical protein
MKTKEYFNEGTPFESMKPVLSKIAVGGSTFYCQQTCGDAEFSIDEWNKAFKMCIDMGLSENEMNKVLEGEQCKTQCVACACIVGEQRMKTQKLIEKINAVRS